MNKNNWVVPRCYTPYDAIRSDCVSVNSSLPRLLARLWRHVSRSRRRQLLLLLVLMGGSALAEVVSLGALLPFLGVLISPDKVYSIPAVNSIALLWGIASPAGLMLPLTAVFMLAAISAGLVRLLLLWATTRVAFGVGSDLSIEVYRRTLYQPYAVHLARNSSEVINGIGSKVGQATSMLHQTLTFLSSVGLMIALVWALILVDPLTALLSAFVFGSAYAVISWLIRRRLESNSHVLARESSRVAKALSEGLGGVRDVLLDGTQSVYCAIYRDADAPRRKAQASNVFIGGAPRYVMEATGMVLIAALAYWLSLRSDTRDSALPLLGTLALGAQRMLPALQASYAAWVSIAGSRASVVDALDLLDQPLPDYALRPVPSPLGISKNIRIERISFRYSDSGPWVLREINVTISKGERVGLVGSTGSGKSTMLDLLMGLLDPTRGCLVVDGNPIDQSNRSAWQQTIAHVPQSIFLADTSIAENIAFGVPPGSVDIERVRRAAAQAQISTFIESCPEGYHARVGERGIRLSGGQRQRIGIARALYKRASVLIFDEATSALDIATEQAVMDSIENLDRNLTVVVIAHRLTTVQRCDRIIQLESGRIVAHGKFEELIDENSHFRAMANAKSDL